MKSAPIFRFVTCCLVIFVWSTCGASAQGPSGDLIIVGGQWFNTETARFEVNKSIVIQNGKFSTIDSEQDVPSDETQVIRLTAEHYILPGLIDLHAHYNVRLLRRRREEFHVMPLQYLANGVTVTFSCGEYDPERMLELRNAIEKGEKLGPRLMNSGPYFGRARPGWHADPEQVRGEVDTWAKYGVGGFKAKSIDPDCLEVLIDQAHKHGLTVTGHLGSGFRNSVNPSTAIDLGIDRIEHFLGGQAMPSSRPAYSSLAGIKPDMPEFKAIVKKFIDNKVYFDATITAYGYFGGTGQLYEHWYDESSLFTDYVRQLIEKRRQESARRNREKGENSSTNRLAAQFLPIHEAKLQTIDDYWRAGGLVTLGTDHVSDSTYLPGFGAHRELAAFVKSGIPEGEAIKIATINGARALNIDAEHGSIAVGKVADLAIVVGNPLEDIRNTRNLKYVVRAGVVHDPKQLLDSVKGKLGPKNEQEASQW